MRRVIGGIFATVVIIGVFVPFVLVGYSASVDQQHTFFPSALHSSAQCFSVLNNDNKHEARTLIQQSDCASDAVPTLATREYLDTYYAFLKSDFYQQNFVRPQDRSEFNRKMDSVFTTDFRQVKADLSSVSYTDQHGDQVRGKDILTMDGTKLRPSYSFGELN